MARWKKEAVSSVDEVISIGTGATAAEGIMLAFDQATVDLDALQRSAYALAAEATTDIRVQGDGLLVHALPALRG